MFLYNCINMKYVTKISETYFSVDSDRFRFEVEAWYE